MQVDSSTVKVRCVANMKIAKLGDSEKKTKVAAIA